MTAKRTILTVGDRVKELDTGLIGYITGVSEHNMFMYSCVGLHYTAWYEPEELEIIELATDETLLIAYKMLTCDEDKDEMA
jgi:hypothetical protein